MRRLAALLVLVSIGINACQPHDPNTDPPPSYDPSAVGPHKFDGGATDPYAKQSDSGSSQSGEEASGGAAQ